MLTALQTTDASLPIDPLIPTGIAVGLALFIALFLFVHRDARLETNIEALVISEPGTAALGAALLIASPVAGEIALAIGIGLLIVTLAGYAGWIDY